MVGFIDALAWVRVFRAITYWHNTQPCDVETQNLYFPRRLDWNHCGCESIAPSEQARARSNINSRSRAFRVSVAARSNSERASAKRPSLLSRSPRALGKRW